MDRTKASAIVNDFFADMNPSLWNGSTSMPKSFDNRAWQYPLTDDVNLEITFVYNEEDGSIIVIWSINLMTAHLIC